jgi:hypothetical protein
VSYLGGAVLSRRLSLLIVAACVLTPASAIAQEPPGEHSPNMSYVKNIPYEARNGDAPNFGTDQEFTRIGGKQYGVFGSYRNGMQIVDISKPARASLTGVYDCGITQGDVQIFRQADERGRVFATYTSDTFGDGTSPCYLEAEALGFDAIDEEAGEGRNGTFIVDITKPRSPRTVSFIEVEQGSHNMTVHPSGDWLYNSNSDLITSFEPAIEYFDISNVNAPTKAGELALPPRPGLGTESHDISFSNDGTRAYSAALSQGVIIDTTDPGAPEVITSFLDPAINVWHQMEDITVGDRQFLIAEDEFAGAAGGPVCPSGGVHVYDITGANVNDPQKVGYWNIDDVGGEADPLATCTAHVFQLHEEAQVMTIAFYTGGVRVVDLSELDSVSLGENNPAGGMKEIGFYQVENADSWSAKTPAIERGEPFYLYGNDMARGLDVYRFDWDAEESASRGQWLTPAEALARTQAGPAVDADYRMNCLLSGA